eukprot:scaffold5538_cov159-Amphora_coffeaeformis.AAC.3
MATNNSPPGSGGIPTSTHMMMMTTLTTQPPGHFRIHSFSTTATELATESASKDAKTSSSPDLLRRQKLKEMRIHRRLRKQEESVRVALRDLQNLPHRTPQQFEEFFDAIMPTYLLSRMDEVLERIESKAALAAASASGGARADTPSDGTMTNLKGDPLPVPNVLETFLQTTDPSDELQIHVLRLLLHDDRATTTSRATLDVEEHVIDTLMAARHKSVVQPLFWNKQDLIRVNSERLHEPLEQNQSKTIDELHAEAKALALHLRHHLPTKYYKQLVRDLDEYVGADEDKIDNESTPASPPIMLQEIYEPETVDRPPLRFLGPILHRNLKSHFFLVAQDIARFFYLEIPEADPDFVEAQQRWTNMRDRFTTTLLDLQEQIQESVRSPVVKIIKPATDETKKRSGRHVKFQVTAPENEIPAPGASVNRVFLDNLPIDIAEEEIRYLYSRCGPIKSVQIYNQRPDLDPGPLNQSQVTQRRRKALTRVSATFSKWQRPRTPVYSIVEFVDDDGYQRAIDDTLRVFGMIIRRHAVRSVPAAKVTSLFLEDLTNGGYCLELQYELERVIHLQVSLDQGQKAKVLVQSCEIAFPSFDLAWEAYTKLRNINGQVQWFRTPKDATSWWTRERGFDF